MMDIIKNPVVIASVAGVLTYVYLYWNYKKAVKKNKHKNKKVKPVNLMVPLGVTIIVWLVAFLYFGNEVEEQSVNIEPMNDRMMMMRNPLMLGGKQQIISDDSVDSYQLISKGLNIPTKMPDAFIEYN